jgi:hypothetical protein
VNFWILSFIGWIDANFVKGDPYGLFAGKFLPFEPLIYDILVGRALVFQNDRAPVLVQAECVVTYSEARKRTPRNASKFFSNRI